ncbi:hypothetical protein [Catenulispora subtropica]|uniref:Uncharacterized protein n=1 Tax=Catenulispora subtropica TaxID=450798 RepID=A0ABP5EMM0_9ACTN
MARLGRNGLVIAAGGLLAFIVSFFPWYGYSGSGASELKAMGVKTSVNAWDAGFAAWFSVLLLLALAVVGVLAAQGIVKWAPLLLGFVEAAGGLLAAVLVLLRWLTYDTASGIGGSVGAMWGTYVALVIAIAVAVFGYLDFVAKGGDIKNIGAVFQGGGQGNQGGGGDQYGQGGGGQWGPPSGQ